MQNCIYTTMQNWNENLVTYWELNWDKFHPISHFWCKVSPFVKPSLQDLLVPCYHPIRLNKMQQNLQQVFGLQMGIKCSCCLIISIWMFWTTNKEKSVSSSYEMETLSNTHIYIFLAILVTSQAASSMRGLIFSWLPISTPSENADILV